MLGDSACWTRVRWAADFVAMNLSGMRLEEAAGLSLIANNEHKPNRNLFTSREESASVACGEQLA
jgi:hypothetical protein